MPVITQDTRYMVTSKKQPCSARAQSITLNLTHNQRNSNYNGILPIKCLDLQPIKLARHTKKLKIFHLPCLGIYIPGNFPKEIFGKMQTDLYTRMLNVLFTTVEVGNHLCIASIIRQVFLAPVCSKIYPNCDYFKKHVYTVYLAINLQDGIVVKSIHVAYFKSFFFFP